MGTDALAAPAGAQSPFVHHECSPVYTVRAYGKRPVFRIIPYALGAMWRGAPPDHSVRATTLRRCARLHRSGRRTADRSRQRPVTAVTLTAQSGKLVHSARQQSGGSY